MLLNKSHKLVVCVSLALSLNAYAQQIDIFDDAAIEQLPVAPLFESGVVQSSEKMALTQLLYGFNLGNDAFYNKALSPAKSLNTNLNDSGRIQEVNDKIIAEMDKVISAFNIADEKLKVQTVKEAINQIDPELNKTGALIQFVNGKPSAAFSRIILLIEKKAGNTSATGEQFLKSFSSYKRSAIPSTTVYEYSDSKNLSQSTISATEGNDNTWKTPLAAAAMPLNQDTVIKKCRQILGWKCITTLYHIGGLLQSTSNEVKYLFAAIHDLNNNPDHPSFAKDKRSINQITGSTALYSIKESANWIMVYGVDAQWNNDKISFASLIQDEFQKDFKRLKERLTTDLKVTQEDFK